MIDRPQVERLVGRFVGEHERWETPVPIPNTAVKPALPMILHCGKVGHRRLLNPQR